MRGQMRDTRTRLWVLAGVIAAAASLSPAGGCNDVPVANLERTFTLEVNSEAGTGSAVKIDFVWMVDNSTSMCEEQFALAKSFDTFTSQLKQFFSIDARVAVTTTDMQCELNSTPRIHASKGHFNQVPATHFPTSCYTKTHEECRANADCDPPGEAGLWTCHGQPLETCIVNPNGTINTTCRRLCTSDQECIDTYGDPDYICQNPGASAEGWGCLRPPQTGGCPAKLPPYLTTETLDEFKCSATVGVYSEKCFKYEQGLRGALAAVDPQGPNPEQAKSFLRDDAYLVLIFISDEDDCSTPDWLTLPEDRYDDCGLLGDVNYDMRKRPSDAIVNDINGKLNSYSVAMADKPGLVPVSAYINRFKALKADPSKVIVAAISGDSLADDEATREADRAAFVESKSDKRTCHHSTYICESAQGVAEWGHRYQELVDGFGINGHFENICSDKGIGPALQNVADLIVKVVNKVCLPKPVADPATLVVTKTLPSGEVQTLILDDPGPLGFSIRQEFAECTVNDQLLPALFFQNPPQPGEKLNITYKGDPLLGTF